MEYKLTNSEKLKVLLSCIDKVETREYHAFKDMVDLLVETEPTAEVLVLASKMYAYEFNEFDEALELAERAYRLNPSRETVKNYLEILKIKTFTDW